jgi:hypothetical protein
MIKKFFIVTILFAMVYISKAQNQDEFKTFLSYFNKTALPIDTRTYMKRKRGENKILPANLNLKYICKNDSSKTYYFHELVSDDTQEISFSGYRTYVIGAADYYSNNNLIFTTYQRARQDDGKMYYLASFTQTGWLCDSILVLSTNPEGEFVDWNCSKISGDKILVFHYSGDFTKKMKTEITVNTYSVDEKTGRFILEKQELFESKCTIDDFNGKAEKCLIEDPFYKY